MSTVATFTQLRNRAALAAVPRPRAQQGVILIITLIILVAMTLASIAMIRSVDTATLIAGNLSFKQSATNSAAAGVEAAAAWLEGNAGTLTASNAATGYYANSQDAQDLTGNKTTNTAGDDLDWDGGASVVSLPVDAAGNTVAYVIHRMCNLDGPLNTATCATDQSDAKGNSIGASHQMQSYQPGTIAGVASRGFYRITVRVRGPKDSVSYVQAVVSL